MTGSTFLAASIASVSSALSLLASVNAAVVDQVTNIDGSSSTGAVGRALSAPGNPIQEIEAAQTITVGVDGYLSQIDVWVGRQPDTVDDLVLSILETDSFNHPASTLASYSISASEITSTSLFTFTMLSIDVIDANLLFSIGDTFAVVLSAPDAPVSSVMPAFPTFSWAMDSSDPYGEGARFIRNLQIGDSWIISANADQALRTWVEPPNLIVDSDVLDFGAVQVGSARQGQITVTNVGNAAFDITAIAQSDAVAPPFAIQNESCIASVLFPSDSCFIEVGFSPQSNGSFADTFEIQSNDPLSPVRTIGLMGQGEPPAPDILVMPTSFDFGQTLIGTAMELEITVSNIGILPLSLGLVGQIDSLSPPFTFTQDYCSNITISENETCVISLQFLPSQLGEFSDNFDISSNDPDTPIDVVMLSGIGTDDLGCSQFVSTDVPKIIPDHSSAVVSSILNIGGSGYITDLNIINLQGLHTWISDLRVLLESPAGTQVIVMERSCGSEDDFDLNLDDEAGASWPCPPTTGSSYLPSNPLSLFDDEFADGTWKLTVNDVFVGEGGSLEDWGLEICAGVLSDLDLDGVPDLNDNCLRVVNPDQRDSNADGYGNLCDADLNNDGSINFLDLDLMRQVFFGADEDADFDGDGAVNFADLTIMRTSFFGAPGPSGIAP